jgi:Fur family transcriptional regulator, ferric uptake regulator
MTHHATRTLLDLGYRLTPQRTLVWDVLRADGGHLSAEQICAQVQEQFPHVNISTVYRTLELLVSLDLVKETYLGPSYRFFEVQEEVPHHHLVCESCGSITHVHDDDLGTLPQVVRAEQGFAIRELTVFGRCTGCRAELEGDRDPAGCDRGHDHGGSHAHP